MTIFAKYFLFIAMDLTPIITDPYTLSLASLMAVSLIILIIYYALFYFRVGHYRQKKKADKDNPNPKLPPVSVVLVAQNEAEWLRNNLVYLLEQEYPEFEVVVVNYLSNDDTAFVLQVLTDYYPRLKVVTFRENASGYQGKKYPFSIGIKSAQHDILLLAEPQSLPKDLTKPCWIKEMVAGYRDERTQIVLGYCGIQHKRGLLNFLQQYDNLDFSTEYLGAALLRHPFTGNGRNLSYRRSLFLKNDGFIYHYYIPDGADDMFVNQNATRRNCSVMLNKDSFTTVLPYPTFRQWHSYRQHRTYTHRFYKFGLKFMRHLRPLNIFLFYLCGALLLVMGIMPWEFLAGALAIKLIWQIISLLQSTKRLGVKPLVAWFSPLLEIYFLFANTFLRLFPLPKK